MSRNQVRPTGRRLTAKDAAVVKAMLSRGDPQHDIAAWFGVNPGRISEINTGRTWAHVPAASAEELPPPGPYGRQAA